MKTSAKSVQSRFYTSLGSTQRNRQNKDLDVINDHIIIIRQTFSKPLFGFWGFKTMVSSKNQQRYLNDQQNISLHT